MKKELKAKAKSGAKSPPVKRGQKSAPGNAAGSTAATAKSKAVGARKGAVAKAKAARVKATTPAAKTKATKAKPAEKRAAKAEKPKATRAKARKAKTENAASYRIGEPVLDPIGDVSSGEARTYLGEVETPGQAEMEAYRAETETAALVGTLEAEEEMTAAAEAASEAGAAVGAEEEEAGAARPPAKLERLQKILSQAGIASRRHAEEMIVAGRVMVNGQVVTQLGSKADPKRDHIRVDGKLLQGAERHRYFVLNKPKGYVTTVSDPEGRPTVMQFFAKTNERLYPVGRLDYQSEGLLLMTNDGELANLVTKAGSGVEKIYLVKVAGQPSEEELERLRAGVAIERGEAGSERVRTAPARIRQVRVGENPWYEVVLTEGRNRELRKMFAAIGHFAEKIRRVGYGPLVLDVEPGKLRELTADEVNALRLTAEGKMKPRRPRTDLTLPKEAGRGSEKRGERPAQSWRNKPTGKRFDAAPERVPGRGGKPFRQQEERAAFGERTGAKPDFSKRQDKPSGARPSLDRPERGRRAGKPGGFGERPKYGERQPFSGGQRPFRGERPAPGAKPRFERQGFKRPEFGGKPPSKPFGTRPAFGGGRESGAARSGERKEWKPRGQAAGRFENVPRKPFRAQGNRPAFVRPEGSFKRSDGPKKRFEGARPPFKREDEGKRRDEITKRAGGESGKDFGRGAKFGAKPGGFGKSRGGGGRGSKSGFSRPGAQRGGWKRRG